MPFSYANLLELIKDKCKTQAQFASAIGLSERSLSRKLNNKQGWKQQEICKACEVLGIEDKDIPTYFFTLKVQSVEQETSNKYIA